MRNLVLSGGIYHPFAETSASIAASLEALGLKSEITSVADGFRRLRAQTYDLVTVNALAWSMTQAEKYAPYRDEYAFSPSSEDRAALLAHHERGGGILGIHTAAICFDGWEQWQDLLPASWVWGRSRHPAPGYMTADVSGTPFAIWDELYCDLTTPPDAEVLAWGRGPEVEASQPIMTSRGRSVYLALGHDLTATASAGYRRLLHRAAKIAISGG